MRRMKKEGKKSGVIMERKGLLPLNFFFFFYIILPSFRVVALVRPRAVTETSRFKITPHELVELVDFDNREDPKQVRVQPSCRGSESCVSAESRTGREDPAKRRSGGPCGAVADGPEERPRHLSRAEQLPRTPRMVLSLSRTKI